MVIFNQIFYQFDLYIRTYAVVIFFPIFISSSLVCPTLMAWNAQMKWQRFNLTNQVTKFLESTRKNFKAKKGKQFGDVDKDNFTEAFLFVTHVDLYFCTFVLITSVYVNSRTLLLVCVFFCFFGPWVFFLRNLLTKGPEIRWNYRKDSKVKEGTKW